MEKMTAKKGEKKNIEKRKRKQETEQGAGCRWGGGRRKTGWVKGIDCY